MRSMIAKGYINLLHLKIQFNVTDTLSKHWSHQSNYKELIKPLLNYHDYEKKEIKSNITVTTSELEQLLNMYEIVPSFDQPSKGSERIHMKNNGETLLAQ